MTIQKTLTIQVSMSSGASEALLNEHLNEFISCMKSTCEDMRLHSWWQSIGVSWEDSSPVEISSSAKIDMDFSIE
jgi:hypothetical protein